MWCLLFLAAMLLASQSTYSTSIERECVSPSASPLLKGDVRAATSFDSGRAVDESSGTAVAVAGSLSAASQDGNEGAHPPIASGTNASRGRVGESGEAAVFRATAGGGSSSGEPVSQFRFRFDSMGRLFAPPRRGDAAFSQQPGAQVPPARSSRSTRFLTTPPQGRSEQSTLFQCAAGGDMSRCSKYKVKAISMCAPGQSEGPGCSMFSTAVIPPQGAFPMSLEKHPNRGLRQFPSPAAAGGNNAGISAGVTVDRRGEPRGGPSQLQLLGKHTMQDRPAIHGKSASAVQASIASGVPISRVPNKLHLSPPRFVAAPQPLCQPSVSQVAIRNTGTKAITMYSTTTDSSNFHPALFDEGRRNRPHHSASEFVMIDPGATVMMSIVFLPREVGVTNATLIVQTSLGGFLYEVSGTGIPSPFGIEPMDAGRMPLGSKYNALVRMLNPLNEFFQITDMFSSTGFISLGVPRARGAPKTHDDVWTVAPHKRQTLADVVFYAAETGKYEDFVHVAALYREDPDAPWASIGFVIPFSATVVESGIHSSVDIFNFGTLTGRLENRTLPIELLNPGSTPVRFKSAVVNSKDAILTLQTNRGLVPAHSGTLVVGSVTFHGQDEGEFRGSVVLKTNVSSLTVPFFAKVDHGSLEYPVGSVAFPLVAESEPAGESYYKTVTQRVYIRNTFSHALTIHRAEVDERYPPEGSIFEGSCFSDVSAETRGAAVGPPLPSTPPPRSEFRAHHGGVGLPQSIAPGNVSVIPIVVTFHPRVSDRWQNGTHYVKVLKLFTDEVVFAVPLCVFDGEYGVLVHDSSPVVRRLGATDLDANSVDFGVMLVGETNVRFVSVFNSFPVPFVVSSAHIELQPEHESWVSAEVFPVTRNATHAEVAGAEYSPAASWSDIKLLPGEMARFAVRLHASKNRDSCAASACPVVVFESEMQVSRWTQRRKTIAPLLFAAEKPSLELMVGRWHEKDSQASELPGMVYFDSPVVAKVFVRNTFPVPVNAKQLSVSGEGFSASLKDGVIEPRSDALHIGWVVARIGEEATRSNISLGDFLSESDFKFLQDREASWQERIQQRSRTEGVVTLLTGPGTKSVPPAQTLQKSVVAALAKPEFGIGDLNFGFVAHGDSSVLPVEVVNPTSLPVLIRVSPALFERDLNSSLVAVNEEESESSDPVESHSWFSSLFSLFFGDAKVDTGPSKQKLPFALSYQTSDVIVQPNSRVVVATLTFAPAINTAPDLSFSLFLRNNVTISEALHVKARTARGAVAVHDVASDVILTDSLNFNCSSGLTTFTLSSLADERLTVKSVYLVESADVSVCRGMREAKLEEDCLATLVRDVKSTSCAFAPQSSKANQTIRERGISLSCNWQAVSPSGAASHERSRSGLAISPSGEVPHSPANSYLLNLASSTCSTDGLSLLFSTSLGTFDMPVKPVTATERDSDSMTEPASGGWGLTLFLVVLVVGGAALTLVKTQSSWATKSAEDLERPRVVASVKEPKARVPKTQKTPASSKPKNGSKLKKTPDQTKKTVVPPVVNNTQVRTKQEPPQATVLASDPVVLDDIDSSGEWQEAGPRRSTKNRDRKGSDETEREKPTGNARVGKPSEQKNAERSLAQNAQSTSAAPSFKRANLDDLDSSYAKNSARAAGDDGVRAKSASAKTSAPPVSSRPTAAAKSGQASQAAKQPAKQRPKKVSVDVAPVATADGPKPITVKVAPLASAENDSAPPTVSNRPRRNSMDSLSPAKDTTPGVHVLDQDDGMAKELFVDTVKGAAPVGSPAKPPLSGSTGLSRSVSVDHLSPVSPSPSNHEVPLWDPWNASDTSLGDMDQWAELNPANNDAPATGVSPGFDFFSYNPAPPLTDANVNPLPEGGEDPYQGVFTSDPYLGGGVVPPADPSFNLPASFTGGFDDSGYDGPHLQQPRFPGAGAAQLQQQPVGSHLQQQSMGFAANAQQRPTPVGLTPPPGLGLKVPDFQLPPGGVQPPPGLTNSTAQHQGQQSTAPPAFSYPVGGPYPWDEDQSNGF